MLLPTGKQIKAGGSNMMFARARAGVQIGYDILGTGRPIVMLHDFGESSRFWCEYGYVKSCLTEGRQVVLIDLRGHGDSSEPLDATACDPINCSLDVIEVLDHAGIRRADILGYGFGGRIALCIAAWASDRVDAAAAGGAHPFAERIQLGPCKSAKGLEDWGGLSDNKSTRKAPARTSTDDTPLPAATISDWPDISDAVARSGVPVLLIVGDKDPHYPLCLSFTEQSGAQTIVLENHDYETTAAAGSTEFLPQVLRFFESPTDNTTMERLLPNRPSGSRP
jgi:pimeloyl-ACP methyl ester carboxylesterase